MPDDLYERDILAWSQKQADLLRRLADGERVNALLDWPNLIDEVETVGRSELHACESLLEQALLHRLKAAMWPDHVAARHWRQEAQAILHSARRRFAPSMRQLLDVSNIYARSVPRAASLAYELGVARSVPEHCPFGLDEFLDADISTFVSRLSG